MDIYDTQPDWKHNPWIIGLLVILFFPFGLYLVWKHPTWQTKTKWIVTGAFASFMVFVVIVNEGEKAQIAKKLSEADVQWAAGQKAGAVMYYKVVEEQHWEHVKHETKPVILSRVIEFHAVAGQDDEAQRWIAKAKSRGVAITTNSEKVATLLTAAKITEALTASRAAETAKLYPVTSEAPAPNSTAASSTKSQYELGKEFQLGDYKYKIISVKKQWRIGEEVFGNFQGEQAGSGATFVIVTYTIENCTNESQTVLSDDFNLLDSQGRKFATSSKVSTALLMHTEDKDFLLSELQPGLPRQMQQGFELPNKSFESDLILVVPKKGLFSVGDARLTVRCQ